MTPSDSKQDTSCLTHGSKQFWFLFTFWSDVSVRIYKRVAASTWHRSKHWLKVKRSSMGVSFNLLYLGLHGRRDVCRRDKLERRSRIVGILSRELYNETDSVGSAVGRHKAAAVDGIHLQEQKCSFLIYLYITNPIYHNSATWHSKYQRVTVTDLHIDIANL